jgi:hypothetical protein
MKLHSAIVLGFAVAAVGYYLSFLLVGGGEGWGTPFIVSHALFVVYPVVAARMATLHEVEDQSIKLEIFLLLLALPLNGVLLVRSIWIDGRQFWSTLDYDALPYLWLSIWAAWQVATIVNLVNVRSLRLTPPA